MQCPLPTEQHPADEVAESLRRMIEPRVGLTDRSSGKTRLTFSVLGSLTKVRHAYNGIFASLERRPAILQARMEPSIETQRSVAATGLEGRLTARPCR